MAARIACRSSVRVMLPCSCRCVVAPIGSSSIRNALARLGATCDWQVGAGSWPATATASRSAAARAASPSTKFEPLFVVRRRLYRSMLPTMMTERSESSEYAMMPAPPLPPTMTVVFGSIKRNGRFSMPPELQIKAAFGELKLDLREALFPDKHVHLVAESLCASVEVLLPEGVTIIDRKSTRLNSSHIPLSRMPSSA